MRNESNTLIIQQRYLYRESGIELLKIIAIFIIVISHVTQTLMSEGGTITFVFPLFDWNSTTRKFQEFILFFFRTFGALGNSLFFACSAWFLIDSNKSNKRKVFNMITEIWIVSVISLVITSIVRCGSLSRAEIIKALFPTTFSLNWYLTYYILFYLFHPFLNKAIHSASKVQLLRLTSALFILYSVIHFVRANLFVPIFACYLIVIYFLMAYFKLYYNDFCNDKKKNTLLFFVGLFGQIFGMLVFNIAGNNINFMHNKMYLWINNVSPFVVIISISALNLAKQYNFKNKTINFISSLSLLIYIIHENIFVRRYFRPFVMSKIYARYGFDQIVLWTLAFAFAIFMASILLASVYVLILKIPVTFVSNKIYDLLLKPYKKIENYFLKIE